MADTSNLAKIRAQHKVLKDNLRQIQRDYRAFLEKTKNKTGQSVREGKDFYDRQATKAAKSLNAFESKHDLDKYKMEPNRKTLKLPKRGGSGVGGGSIKSPDETARGRMSLLKKKM